MIVFANLDTQEMVNIPARVGLLVKKNCSIDLYWTEWSAFGLIRVIWNHEYEFRPKLHETKFNYHFITSILKSQNSVGQIQHFLACTN